MNFIGIPNGENQEIISNFTKRINLRIKPNNGYYNLSLKKPIVKKNNCYYITFPENSLLIKKNAKRGYINLVTNKRRQIIKSLEVPNQSPEELTGNAEFIYDDFFNEFFTM